MSVIMKMMLFVAVFAVLSHSIANQEQYDGHNVDLNEEHYFESEGMGQQYDEYKEDIEEEQEGLTGEQEDLEEFSEHMADFLPIESFTMRFKANQAERIVIVTDQLSQKIRGIFHTQAQDDGSENMMTVMMYDNQRLVKSFYNQRLGIFNVPIYIANSRIRIQFFAQADAELYFSYEIVHGTSIEEQFKETNETDIQMISKKFDKINKIAVQQEGQMNRIIQISRKHRQKIERYTQSSIIRIGIQTLFIIFGGAFSLWLLKKQIYEGYQMLV